MGHVPRVRLAFITVSVALLVIAYLAVGALGIPVAGVSYFAFLPVALIALATGPAWASLAALATGTSFATFRPEAFDALSNEPIVTTTAAARALAYIAVAALIGKFAADQRGTALRLENLANRDALTSLLNGRAYRGLVAERLQAGRPFALILCDMDGLKVINDHHGHQVGDEALQALSRLLAGTFRNTDDIARIGGDEFAILANGATEEHAAMLCTHLQHDLEQLSLSASFGWAIFPTDELAEDALFALADGRLYENKRFKQRAADKKQAAIDNAPPEPALAELRAIG